MPANKKKRRTNILKWSKAVQGAQLLSFLLNVLIGSFVPTVLDHIIHKDIEYLLPVLLQGLADVNIWHHISIDQQKVWAHKVLCINIPEHIPQGAVQVWGDDVDCVGRGGPTPLWLSVRHSIRSKSSIDTNVHKIVSIRKTYSKWSLILLAIQQQKTNVSCTPVDVRNSRV